MPDDLIQSDEGTAANKQNIGRIDTDIVLFGMLTSAFRRHVTRGPFHKFQQCLLHTFAGDVAGDRGALGFAADFIDLIDVDDARLSFFHVEFCGLQEL